MGMWARLIGRERKNDTLDLWREVYGTLPAKSGQTVNWKTALQVTTVLACARVIAEGIAQVPLKLFEESADGRSRLPAKKHPLYRLLHRRPNDTQTSFEFREQMGLHLVLCGNFFAFKNMVGGRLVELLPFEPGDVTVVKNDDWSLSYDVKGSNGAYQRFPAAAIWHVRGPSWNGWMGLETVKLAREAIGLAMATEEHHAKLHTNGAKPGGLLSVEGTLGEDQYKKLNAWIEQNYTGADNAWRTMILDRAAKFTSLAMTGVDSQHLETRRFQIEEICRAARVLPIMVGHSDKTATFASAVQMFLAHVVHTLSPYYERIEQSIDVNLLSEKDQDRYYAKFIEEGLLRGAPKETAEFLTLLATNGIMTRNEARAKLDLNPLDGLDEPLTPQNMAVGAKPEDPGQQGGSPKGRRPFDDKVFEPFKHPRDAQGRFIGRGAGRRRVRRLARRSLADRLFNDWLEFGRVSGPRFSGAAGRDVDGWRFIMRATAIRHIHGEHGSPAAEAARGQRAIVLSDYERIMGFLSRAPTSAISRGELTRRHKMPTVVVDYTDRGTRYRLVLEQQPGRRFMAVHTFMKW